MTNAIAIKSWLHLHTVSTGFGGVIGLIEIYYREIKRRKKISPQEKSIQREEKTRGEGTDTTRMITTTH